MNLKSQLIAATLMMVAFSALANDRSWQEYLQKADRNGDGQIDRFEIMLIPPRHGGGVKMMLGPRFKEIDRDGNGKLGLDEVDADRVARGVSDANFRDLLTRHPAVAQQDFGVR